jgi:hypothetical protein
MTALNLAIRPYRKEREPETFTDEIDPETGGQSIYVDFDNSDLSLPPEGILCDARRRVIAPAGRGRLYREGRLPVKGLKRGS